MEQGRTTSLRLSTKSTKLVPKDISESLGKVPPQALDLEETILGALLLEKERISLVISFLRPDHFYSEQNKEVYQAILDLVAAGDPVDMRTVVYRLKKTGKLELVGGHFRIAEISTKASTGHNIEYHARIMIEMAMKRDLIQLASQIHHQAYEDDTNIHELIDKVTTEFAQITTDNVSTSLETKIKALWQSTMVTQAPPPETVLLAIDGTPIATLNNHTLLVGKKKSRKTLFIVLMVSYFLKAFPEAAAKILLFDTEQGKSHVWEVRERIRKMTGLSVPIFYLRGMSPADRREFIAGTVQYWSPTPMLIFIDGIRDLMSNINDPDESTDLIVWLERLTLNHNLHVCNVLHLNKTDNNARGHIGSELLNKAQTTIEMELDEKNGCTIVRCESSRGRPFETFAFTHSHEGLPEIVGAPVSRGNIVSKDQRALRLEAIFTDGPLKYSELIDQTKAHFEVGTVKAKALIASWIRDKLVLKSGQLRDPNAVYKLISSTIISTPQQPPANGTLFDTQNTANPDQKNQPLLDPDDLPF